MESLYNLNFYHLIIRPHKYDEEKFKPFTPFVVNWIQAKKSISFYSISEELGENDGYHLDIVIFSSGQIEKNILNNKGSQLGLRGHALNYRDNNLPNTTNTKRYFCKKPETEKNTKEFNVKKIIGYSFKEQDCDLRNWNNLEEAGITKEDIIDCLKFYQDNKHTKEKPVPKDVTPLNTKNIMWEMKKYIMEKYVDLNKKIRWDTLVTDSVEDDYCWASITEKQTRKIQLQLKLKFKEIDEDEKDELNDGLFKRFEKDQEYEMIKSVRHRERSVRLQLLKEYGFITEKELNIIMTHKD